MLLPEVAGPKDLEYLQAQIDQHTKDIESLKDLVVPIQEALLAWEPLKASQDDTQKILTEVSSRVDVLIEHMATAQGWIAGLRSQCDGLHALANEQRRTNEAQWAQIVSLSESVEALRKVAFG